MNVKKRVRDDKQKVIAEDEEIAAERHRRRITRYGQDRVIHAVPVADEWIDKTENEY
jgi:hypothetical protein